MHNETWSIKGLTFPSLKRYSFLFCRTLHFLVSLEDKICRKQPIQSRLPAAVRRLQLEFESLLKEPCPGPDISLFGSSSFEN